MTTEQTNPTLQLLISQGFSDTILDRFWSKVDKTDDCWLWTGATTTQGFGKINRATSDFELVHRVSWLIHNGPLPKSVSQTCRNKLCVNPAHLVAGKPFRDPKYIKPTAERIAELSVLDPATGCLNWIGCKTKTGYGKFELNGMKMAHRIAWEIKKGSIPEGKEIHHKCRNRGCVNVDHLELLTHQQNCEVDFRVTHCPHGHEYLPGSYYEQTGKNGKKYRACKQCSKDRASAQYRSHKSLRSKGRAAGI